MPPVAVARRALCLAGLLGLALAHGLLAADPPNLDAAARDGARALQASLLSLLREHGALTPDGMGEDRPRRLARQRQQAELEEWFEARGRHLQLAPEASARDRQLASQFPLLMADAEWLGQSLAQRRAVLARLERHASAQAAALPTALARLLAPTPATPGDGRLEAFLLPRLAQPPALRALYFGRDWRGTTAALYTPDARVIWLNLNHLPHDPPALADCLLHELWHHWLPGPGPGALAEHPWLEGFIEVLAEYLAAELRQAAPPDSGLLPRGTIDYPVLSAWASLTVATDRRLVLDWLAGLRATADFAAQLAERGPLGAHLAPHYAAPWALSDERRARLESLLSAWGWREDDGRPLSLAEHQVAGQFTPDTLARLWRRQRPLARDLVEASAVLALQDLAPHLPPATQATLAMPAPLRAHLALVLDYVRDPVTQWRQP